MILQALKEYYDRKAADPASGIAPLGWEWKEIPFLLVLDNVGNFVRIEETNHKPFLVPGLGESKGNGIKSNYPWENAEYIFGIPLKEDKHNAVPKRRQEFIARVEEYAAHDWTKAILAFLKNVDVGAIAKRHRSEWNRILKGDYILFAIDGIPISNLDAFKQVYHPPRAGQPCVCLVSGKHDTLKEKEPAIKGSGFYKISPNKSIKSELHIVSFNEESFTSFHKKQGQNAPIGQSAALAYTTALNTLLRKNSRQKMQVGDATVVFWASQDNCLLEDKFADIFDEPPQDDPDRGVSAVESLLSSIKTGVFFHDEEKIRFYVLGLAPNSARLSVRFWHVGTVAEMEQRFADWFENLRIIHEASEKEHLSLSQLLLSTARFNKDKQKWKESVPPNLPGAVMRSILDGTPYPSSLFSATILRIKAERDVTYPRAKLVKAFLNHNHERNLNVSLDKNITDVGYRLGRLFAVLEWIQQAANPGINATIRDRFYASASSTPAAVFGNLMRLKNHHLTKLKSKKHYEDLIGEIIYRDHTLPGVVSFPPHLSLVEQGMFAIGYYHQRQEMMFEKQTRNKTATQASTM